MRQGFPLVRQLEPNSARGDQQSRANEIVSRTWAPAANRGFALLHRHRECGRHVGLVMDQAVQDEVEPVPQD